MVNVELLKIFSWPIMPSVSRALHPILIIWKKTSEGHTIFSIKHSGVSIQLAKITLHPCLIPHPYNYQSGNTCYGFSALKYFWTWTKWHFHTNFNATPKRFRDWLFDLFRYLLLFLHTLTLSLFFLLRLGQSSPPTHRYRLHESHLCYFPSLVPTIQRSLLEQIFLQSQNFFTKYISIRYFLRTDILI